MESEGVVLTCTLVTLASTTGGDLRSGKSIDPKKVVGAFLSMTVCAIVAEMNGEIGAGLAVAIAGTALVKFGIPALGGAPTQTTLNGQSVVVNPHTGLPTSRTTSKNAQKATVTDITKQVPVFAQIQQTLKQGGR